MKAYNKMSAAALKESQHSDINFVRNPKTGKLFFTCGTITGYVSPAVQAKLNDITLADIQYAECSIDDNPATAVPCLMMVGDSKKNVVRTL